MAARSSSNLSRLGLPLCRLGRPVPRTWNHVHQARYALKTEAVSRSFHSIFPGKKVAPANIRPLKPCRDLRGKVAIVTGAGSQGSEVGNGRATSMLLAEDGATVVCVDRQLELAEKTVSMIEEMGKGTCSPEGTLLKAGKAVAMAADVTREADCKRIVQKTMSMFGRLDILVNVVGIMGVKGDAVDLADLDAWAKGLEINVTSMMLMARFAIPAMMEKERSDQEPIRGSIVNMGSVAGLQGGTPHLLYPTSKGAVVNMTRAMAAHHGADGIRVNCVCPGQSQKND